MSEASIRQQIYTILKTVPNVGKVYDYERWAVDWGKFIELFKDSSGKILGWEICRTGVTGNNISTVEEEDLHQYVIKGYMAVQDADQTEKKFNLKIEEIRAAFRRNFSLSGTCELVTPPSAEVIDTRTFGSVLCHYCELKLTAQEIQ